MSGKILKAITGLRKQVEYWQRKGWTTAVKIQPGEYGREKKIDQKWWKASNLLGELITVIKVYEKKFETGDYEPTGWGKPVAKRRTRKGKKQ